MPDDSTKTVLNSLFEREAALAAELRDVQVSIKVLGGQPQQAGAGMTGAGGAGASPASNGFAQQPKGASPEIKPDTFYAMSHHQAARTYLQMVGHADKLENILAALQLGGVEIGGIKPAETLRATLVQNSKVFAKITSNTFGLREFYPHLGDRPNQNPREKRKKAAKPKAAKAKTKGKVKKNKKKAAPKVKAKAKAQPTRTQTPQPTGEGIQKRVEAIMKAAPDRVFHTADVARAAGVEPKGMSLLLGRLAAKGVVVKTGEGGYRAAIQNS